MRDFEVELYEKNLMVFFDEYLKAIASPVVKIGLPKVNACTAKLMVKVPDEYDIGKMENFPCEDIHRELDYWVETRLADHKDNPRVVISGFYLTPILYSVNDKEFLKERGVMVRYHYEWDEKKEENKDDRFKLGNFG